MTAEKMSRSAEERRALLEDWSRRNEDLKKRCAALLASIDNAAKLSDDAWGSGDPEVVCTYKDCLDKLEAITMDYKKEAEVLQEEVKNIHENRR